MSLVVPKSGQVQVLKGFLNIAGNVLKLYSNSPTLSVNTVLSDLTEVSGGGYSSVTLTAGTWNFSQGDPSVALYGSFVNFDFTGPPAVSTVNGYYIVDSGGNLILAEKFDTVTPINGTSIPVRPKVTAASVS